MLEVRRSLFAKSQNRINRKIALQR